MWGRGERGGGEMKSEGEGGRDVKGEVAQRWRGRRKDVGHLDGGNTNEGEEERM